MVDRCQDALRLIDCRRGVVAGRLQFIGVSNLGNVLRIFLRYERLVRYVNACELGRVS